MQNCGVQVGARYRSDKQAAVFCHEIAEVTRQPLREMAKSSSFLSVLCDGSTDVSIREQEVSYLRTAVKGVVRVKMLGMQGVARPNAQSIHKAIEHSVTTYAGINLEEFYSKLVALGSDGANVMIGARGGVVALLRQKQPALQGIHCFAHRLELAYKDTLKTSPLFVKANDLLLNIYLFYHNSAPMRSGLQETYHALRKTCQVPTRVGGTRWMPHTQKALGILLKNYDAITMHLSQVAINGSNDQKSKTKGFLDQLRCPSNIKFYHLLWDIVLVLQRLTLRVQETKSSVSEIHSSLKFTVQELKKYRASPGDKLATVTNLSSGDVFMGQSLVEKIGRGHAESFDNNRVKLLDNLLQYLDRRFADTKESVMQATTIANLKTWPSCDSDYFVNFGNEAVTVLSGHYESVLSQAGVDTDQVGVEWASLKTAIAEHGHPAKLTWQYINECYRDDHMNILALVDLCLTLPASSAECERGFSLMKVIKTDWRNKLKSSTLTDLMTIVRYSPEVDAYDPTAAVDLWFKNEGSRRSRRTAEDSYLRDDLDNDDSDVDKEAVTV